MTNVSISFKVFGFQVLSLLTMVNIAGSLSLILVQKHCSHSMYSQLRAQENMVHISNCMILLTSMDRYNCSRGCSAQDSILAL